MAAAASANNDRLNARSQARHAIRSALRKFVGRGTEWTVKALSAESNVPERLIESAMCDPDSTDYRDLAPHDLFALIDTLGPVFGTIAISPSACGVHRVSNAGGTPASITAEMASATAEVATAAADGVFDHTETARLALTVGPTLVAIGGQLLASAGVAG